MTMTHGMSGLGRNVYDFPTSESQEQGGTECGALSVGRETSGAVTTNGIKRKSRKRAHYKQTSTPGGIRTPNPRFRRPMLYPIELRTRER